MSNSLEKQVNAYDTAMNAIKVARRVIDARTNPVSNTRFYGMSPDECHAELDRAEDHLNQLASFALFAAFERILREQVADNLASIGDTQTAPPEMAPRLQAFLKDSVDNWRVDHIIDLFSPPATTQDVSDAKGIRTHRHHIAHGAAPPVAIPPRTVYDQLTRFLNSAGLL